MFFFKKNIFVCLFVCSCCFLFTFPVYEGFILLLTVVPVLSSTTVIAVFNEGLLCFNVRHQILLRKKWKIIRVILDYKKIPTWVKNHHCWIQAIFKLVLYSTPQEGERMICTPSSMFNLTVVCLFFLPRIIFSTSP